MKWGLSKTDLLQLGWSSQHDELAARVMRDQKLTLPRDRKLLLEIVLVHMAIKRGEMAPHAGEDRQHEQHCAAQGGMNAPESDEEPRLTFRQWLDVLAASDRDFDRVLSLPQWAKLAGISERTGRDIIARGDGPKIVQLSENRIGIRVCDHREWLAARIRKSIRHGPH
jgi:predicted DNA-binding transcriptional regulator AlpA